MKRSCSVPNVAKLLQVVEIKPVSIQTNLSVLSKGGLSSSNISLPGELSRAPSELSPRRQPLSSPLPLSRINSPTSKYRVAQIKKEETLDERAIEREVQEQIQLNKTLDEKLHTTDDPNEPMEIWTLPSSYAPSAFVSPSSPLNRMRSRSLTPTSPGTSRTFSYRRSCSPVLRPSSLCFQIGKRKTRDFDSEDMDTSPTVPSKKHQLGYASPFSLSPCVSPLMGSSPLHHSFSRKSSTTQELTPLSSPSSIITNPFALKYDNGSAPDHWQSLSGSGSACSSTGHSPSVGATPTSQRATPISLDELPTTKLASGTAMQRHSNGALDDHKGVVLMDSVDVITDTPTPLSPKGLQFRQKPFPLSVATLPSPIPRQNTNNGNIESSFSHVASGPWLSPSTSSQPISPTVIVEGDRSSVDTTTNHKHLHQHSLQHDRHLSPFNSDIHLLSHPSRIIKQAKPKLQQKFALSSRQMIRPEPQRPYSVSSLDNYTATGRSTSMSGSLSTNRLSISSPLTKLSMSSTFDSEQPQSLCKPRSNSESRTPLKRRMSDTSTDSQEDGFMMESDDGSVVGGFEESLPTTKAVRTIS